MIVSEANLEEITVSAIVTRADGTVEDHGTVCHWTKGDEAPPPRGIVKMLKDFFSRNNLKDEL